MHHAQPTILLTLAALLLTQPTQAKPASDYTPTARDTVIQVMWEDCQALYAQKAYSEAAPCYLALADGYPRSELAPKALYNAAVALVASHRTMRAVAIYERLIVEYPSSEQCIHALLALGRAYHRLADFEKASYNLERVAGRREWRQEWPEETRAALLEAGRLQEVMGHRDEAIALYTRWLAYYGKTKPKDAARVAFLLASLHDEGAREAYTAYLKQWSHKGPAEQTLAAYVALGQMDWEAGDRRQAMRSFNKVLTLYASEALYTNKSANASVDEAMFMIAEEKRLEFEAVELTMPQWLLKKRLTRKMKLLQEAEVLYFKVLDKRPPHEFALQHTQQEWRSAVTYRIGEMYLHLAETFNKGPKEQTTAVQAQLKDHLDSMAFREVKTVHEKTIRVFEVCVRLAAKRNAHNRWVEMAHQRLEKLAPDTWKPLNELVPTARHTRSGHATRGFVGGDPRTIADSLP